MTSKVDVCNAALQRVGSQRIDSLSDPTESAISCNTIYDLMLQDVLNAGDWSCCTRRATLAQLSTTPAFGYNYQYQLPVDPECFKVIDVFCLYPNGVDYAVEGDVLLTDESSVQIRYIAKLPNPGDYSAGFNVCLIDRIALELSYAKTANSSLRAELKQTYMQDLASNLAQDAVQGRADNMYIDTYLKWR